MDMGSPEECLSEAEACERLAGLTRSEPERQVMMVLAFKWRSGESLQEMFWKRG